MMNAGLLCKFGACGIGWKSNVGFYWFGKIFFSSFSSFPVLSPQVIFIACSVKIGLYGVSLYDVGIQINMVVWHLRSKLGFSLYLRGFVVKNSKLHS